MSTPTREELIALGQLHEYMESRGYTQEVHMHDTTSF